MMDGLYTGEDDPDRPFHQDRWELYHVAEDPSEAHDLAAAEPERLRALQELWWHEAGRYGALPLQSRRIFALGRPHPVRARERVVLRPGAAPLPEELAPNVKMRPHRIVADIEIGAGGAEGVLVAKGGRFGGYSLYVHDGRLHYTTNFAGIERTTVSSPAPLGPGRHVVGVALDPAGGMGMRAELSVGGEVVATAEASRTAPFRFALAGEGLCCGYDDGTPVADVYESPFPFTGTIHEAVIDVSGTPVPLRDLVAEVRRAWMTQ
jgi:arylsulfatase